MAAIRNQKAAVGSAQWIKDERDQLNKLVDQDVEEFGYSARNELEWLNEHMAEIFSSNHMTVTDVFKTPGKLRGKTPRTARKADAQRAPLTDLFAPNPQSIMSPARSTPFFQKISKIAMTSHDDRASSQDTIATQNPFTRVAKKNTDSGYHGMTEDEMEDVTVPLSTAPAEADAPVTASSTQKLSTGDSRMTDESFVSAQEGPGPQNTNTGDDDMDEEGDPTVLEEDHEQHKAAAAAYDEYDQNDDNDINIHEDDQAEAIVSDDQDTPTAKDPTDSGSYVSSPERSLLRKSSLNFASLPPRETLTGKRSMGVRNSQYRASQAPSSRLNDADMSDTENDEDQASIAQPVNQSKTSTQLLHEKINMLGQTREPRASKSIPSMYPQLSQASQPSPSRELDVHNDDDDSWIAPIGERNSIDLSIKMPEQAFEQVNPQASSTEGPQKSISTSHIPSPTKASMAPEASKTLAPSASVPNDIGQTSTTPTPSPRKFADGPLSASKARFYSVLKSAKGMFASSAGTSVQAKLEAASLHKATSNDSIGSEIDTSKIPGSFADDAASVKTTNTASSRPLSAFFSPSKETRKTRSSTEGDRKKKSKEAQKAADVLEKAREQERKRAAKSKPAAASVQDDHALQEDKENTAGAETEASQSTKTASIAGKLRAPGRLAKPTKQTPASSVRPVPVNIRVASQAQRLGSVQPSGSTNNLSENAQTPGSRPASAATRPGMSRAGSANPPSGARLKALEVAARKKEQEEKAAAKKAEQKKELERKRAAKLEEERRLEQERRAEEQRKLQEARAAAQRQAEQRKLEQQRREAAAAKAKADAELAEALERERARAAVPQQRTDLPGTIRQLNKASVVQDTTANKAVKRPMQGDDSSRTSTINRGMAPYQQQDAKRRRTNDEEGLEQQQQQQQHQPARPSTMAPPMRPSAMVMANKFPHGYAHAPPPAAHHAQTAIYKASVTSQNHLSAKPGPSHPTDTIKLSNARIPFADSSANPKTPGAAAPVFKTPARPLQPFSAHTKPSPAYPPGDSIALPDIESDEDSDASESDARDASGFRAPSWVASPALRDLLTQQQLVDPESVFGPVAALNMDDVFRGGNAKSQDRIRRYRDRGESALWHESGDAVTSAEKRRDREMRERVVRDGGWTFTRD